MKALTWHGKSDIRCESVPDPRIEHGQDAIIKVTSVGQSKKADPVDVARDGFEALMSGEASVVSGWKNKVQAAMTGIVSPVTLAEQHRKMAEPGTGRRAE